jgi:uncharacterized protein YndB with AHSA1/START domain
MPSRRAIWVLVYRAASRRRSFCWGRAGRQGGVAEQSVVLATLTDGRGGKSIEAPVANVTRNRDGQVTEFWSAVTDPEAAPDFWA